MNIYLAGVPGGGTTGWCRREKELTPMWKYRLWTYYWIVKDKAKMKKPNTVNLFLDSGAFSAWTKNTEVNIHDYIAFIKKHERYIDVYANLDVIAFGKHKQPDKETAEATLKNQRIMEKAGLNPIPAFHYGEPMEYLDFYVKNYPYIALGIAGNSTAKLLPWMEECFSKHICDKNGMPKVKVHGFAVTSLKLMLRFPWYSVDSTSWVVTGRIGKIFVPHYRGGKWLYDENSMKIGVSNRSPSKGQKNQHINTLQPKQRDIILHYIHSKGYVLGSSKFIHVDSTHIPDTNERWAEKKEMIKNNKRLLEVIEEEGLCNKYQLRDEINIIYFNDLEKHLPAWPWPFKMKLNEKLF